MKTLFLLLLLPSLALAQRDLNLVLIDGPYALTDQQVDQVVQNVATKVSDPGIGFRRIRKIRVSDKCSKWLNLANSLTYYNCQKKALQKLKFSKNQGYIHFVAPPMVVGNLGYVGGWSDGKCMRKTTRVHSLGNGISANLATGQDRLGLSSLVMSHELAHSTGALHDPQSTIAVMHPNAGYYFTLLGFLPWSKTSVSAIKKCR